MSVLLIPCAVVLGVCWILVLVIGGLFAQPVPGSNASSVGGPLFLAVFSFTIIVLSTQLLVLCWGVLNLLLSMRGNMKIQVIRVCVTVAVASICLTAFGIAFGKRLSTDSYAS